MNKRKIIKLLADSLKIEVTELQKYDENSSLVDLGLDSLGFVQFIVNLEMAFGIEVNDEDLILSKLLTLNDLYLMLSKYFKSEDNSRKVIILDCDNVLWNGVAGEEDINVPEAFALFHKELTSLRNHGILLCLCSKNNAQNIQNAFRDLKISLKKEDIVCAKSTHNRRERPVCGHRGRSRGPFYYRITTFGKGPWDARDPHKTTFMALKHVIRLSIWQRQKETPGVEKAPGVSSPQRKESGRSGRDDGELRFGVRPGHPRKAVTSISQAEALAHGLTHLHHLVFAAVLARELDWCAALQDAREDARPWGVVGIGLRSDVWVEVRRDDHRPAVLVTRVDDVVDMPHDVIGAAVRPQVVDDEEVILEEARLRVLALVERHRLDVGHDVLHAGLQRGEPEVDDPVGDCRGIERLTCAHLSPEEQPIHVIA